LAHKVYQALKARKARKEITVKKAILENKDQKDLQDLQEKFLILLQKLKQKRAQTILS
jgi:hypothetical protein